MKKFLKLVLFLLVVALSVLAFKWVYYHNRSLSAEKFNVRRALNDISIIADKPHSVFDDSERDAVRSFLVGRLVQLGGEPVVYRYDSVECKFGKLLDISNIYCEFRPRAGSEPSSWILLSAHYDSRYKYVRDNVLQVSKGAADDGYGLAVILELLRGALSYQNEWNQGIKVIFTDGEEVDMAGSSILMKMEPSLTDNVGLLVNVEARGAKGPAMIFESSKGNSKVMDFYFDNSPLPLSYSLSSSVYEHLPSYTDFQQFSQRCNGLNIAVIDNLDIYHSSKDTYNNVSEESLLNYGLQLEPMLRTFLVGKEFSDPHYFDSEDDMIFFTIPLLGSFSCGKGLWYILESLLVLLFSFIFGIYLSLGKITIKGMTGKSLLILVLALISAALAAVIGLYAVIPSVLIFIAVYLVNRKKNANYAFEMLFGLSLLLFVLALVLFIATGETFMFSIPLFAILIALLLHLVVFLNNMAVFSAALIALTGYSFLYILALSLGNMADLPIAFLAVIYLTAIVSLFEIFMIQKR